MDSTAEIIEWATDSGSIELEDGRTIEVSLGDELLAIVSADGDRVTFLEHYPRVLH